MKISESKLRQIIRKELMREMDRDAMMDLEARERAGDVKQDLSKPIPIDDLQFVDEEGNGSMMFPGVGYSYSVSKEKFEAEKEKIKKRYGADAMISTPDPRYPKSKKIHSAKFDQAQSRENQNFMRHQSMMRKRLGREPGLGS